MEERNYFIDKICITANILEEDLVTMKELFNGNGHYLHEYSYSDDKTIFSVVLFDHVNSYNEINSDFSGIYVRYNSFLESRKFRIEYNPSKLSKSQNVFLKENILDHLYDKKFSRLDLAFDTSEKLLDCRLFHNFKKVKSIEEYDRLIYKFMGADSSHKNICIYEKSEEVQRLEFRFRHDYAARFLNDELDPFKNFEIRKDFITEELSGDYYCRVKTIIDEPKIINQFSRNTRTKIRRLLKSLKCTDLTPFFKQMWQQKKSQILKELNDLIEKNDKQEISVCKR